ncbi:MAG: hypothetical protein AB9835_00360 [Eubacteriales bacterium]
MRVASGAAYVQPKENAAFSVQEAPAVFTEISTISTELSALPSFDIKEDIPIPLAPSSEAVIKEDKGGYTIIGEAYNTYVIVQTRDNLLLVDKHAAHERILYEELVSGQGRDAAQLLLPPVTVELTPDACDALFTHSGELEGAGFELERFGYNTALVRTVPQSLMSCDIPAVISEVADRLREGAPGMKNSSFARAMYTAACKAAIKGGRVYGREQIEWLIEKLMSLDNMLYCPHGRPAVMEIPKKRLDYKFGR